MAQVIRLREAGRPYVCKGVRVYTNFSLNVSLEMKRSYSKRGCDWTLFINSKGTIAHAVHKNGIFMRIEGLYYLEGCQREYIINYFYNKLRELI